MKTLLTTTALLLLFSCHKQAPIDRHKFTDVTVTNWSEKKVKCFLTVPSTDSPVGKFGIAKDSLLPGATTGFFWLDKGCSVSLNSSKPSMGYILTFGAQNQDCQQAIANGWKMGINNFEFTLNCFDKAINPHATGGNESADITNVDGVNAVLQYSVDTTEGVIGRKFWDYSLTDSAGQLLVFGSARTSGKLFGDCNLPGIFPYDCDVCYGRSSHAPIPCFTIPKDYYCSDSLAKGSLYTCQINRPGQGGVIHVEFFGFAGKPEPAIE